MNITTALQTAEVLKAASDASLLVLADIGRICFLKKGDILFFDKENVNDVYIVISGTVSLFKINGNGEKKVIFILGKGKMINEVILQDLPASISCEIFEDAEILSFPKKEFLRVMEKDFSLTKEVLNSMALKIRRLYRQLKNTSNSIRGDKRIAAKLWKLSMDYGVICEQGIKIDMEISITYLADLLGSKRETVSRQLKELTIKNLLIMDGHYFIVPDRDKLGKYFKES